MTNGYKGKRGGSRKKSGGGSPPTISVRSGYLEMAMWESGGRGPPIKLQKRIPPKDGQGGDWRDMGAIWMFPNEVERNLTEILENFLEKMPEEERERD